MERFGDIKNLAQLSKTFHSLGKLSYGQLKELYQELMGETPLTNLRKPLVAALCYTIQRHFMPQIEGLPDTESEKTRQNRLEAIKQCMIPPAEPQADKSQADKSQAGQKSSQSTVKREKETKETDMAKEKKEVPQWTTKTIPELIAYAKELGAPAEKVEKYANRPKGLARMTLGNIIRGRLRKQAKK